MAKRILINPAKGQSGATKQPCPSREPSDCDESDTDSDSDSEPDDADECIESDEKDDVSLRTCKICNKILARVDGLVKHLTILTGVKPYACPICDKKFSSEDRLANHAVRHSKERPYKCQFCSWTAKKKHSIRVHELMHTNDKKYVCDTCEKKFVTSTQLQIHKRSAHTGERPFACTICKRAFADKGDLTKHAVVHQTERPFPCKKCDSTFKTVHELNKHYRRSHVDVKQFVCATCDKPFPTKHSLEVHQTFHEPPQLVCPDCPLVFKWPASLALHRSRDHAIGLEPCDTCTVKSNLRLWKDKTNKPWKLCTGCYKTANPRRVEEKEMIAYLTNHFKFPAYSMDRKINGETCTGERPDLLYLSPNERALLVEMNEHEHRAYKCEEARLSKISENLGGQPLTAFFINPHSYKVPKGNVTLTREERYDILLREMTIACSVTVDNQPHIKVIYICYSPDNPTIVQAIPKELLYE